MTGSEPPRHGETNADDLERLRADVEAAQQAFKAATMEEKITAIDRLNDAVVKLKDAVLNENSPRDAGGSTTPPEYRLFIDHRERRATLHTAVCPVYLGRSIPEDDPLEALWSFVELHSEQEAAATVLEHLKADDGTGYELIRHSCLTAARANAGTAG